MRSKTQAVKFEEETRDADTCMALGAGVGVLGGAAAALTGAVCPLCLVVAPGLVGLGAYRRWRASRQKVKSDQKKSI